MKGLLKVAAAVFVLVASVGASCGGGSGPGPTPTPEPTPTPVGYDPSGLLRQQDGRLYKLDMVTPFNFDQAVQCCGFQDGPEWNSKLPGVENHRWPLISIEAMDYFGGYMLNAFHFRMGPFYGDADHESDWKDIGGPYAGGPGSDWNPAFWTEVERIAQHAYERGRYIEVNVVDTWYCKHAQWGDESMPWSDAAVQSCGRTSNAEVEAYVRKVVSTFGKFPNIIWAIDNEGAEIQGAKIAWWQWVRDVIRSEEQNVEGKFVHLIGASYEFCDVTDYCITHEKAGLTVPKKGRWTLNNERNPQFPVDQEIANFKNARERGLSYAFWRAEMKVPAMTAVLEGYRDVINGTGSGPVGCYAPASEDPNWIDPPTPQGNAERLAVVNEAKARVGNRCGATAPCTEEPCAPPIHLGALQTTDLVAAELRKMGYCASRNADALFIKNTDGTFGEYKIVAYGTGCYTNDPALLPKLTWRYGGSSPVACSEPNVPVVDEILCKLHQATNHIYDCTPKAHGQPILPEGHPEREACEAVSCGGVPSYVLENSNGLTLSLRPNPYQFKVSGTGRADLRATCPRTGGTDLSNYVVEQ